MKKKLAALAALMLVLAGCAPVAEAEGYLFRAKVNTCYRIDFPGGDNTTVLRCNHMRWVVTWDLPYNTGVYPV